VCGSVCKTYASQVTNPPNSEDQSSQAYQCVASERRKQLHEWGYQFQINTKSPTKMEPQV